ncbi:molybdate ABC transporter permease subunit [Candidatus Marinarcus aquaticus]|uniref:Molybdenum transport system permease n=1 Tax=Candidatus Marinarcus aquaticus TaxID=2044504 RepID=A0A4Q0XR43_9BACT|nr:molybdate ABC transporter permease subunit [Candidatus Marinarcus aquaticus]RXJ58098.1 molybdate ABC transporter permease subunit [Candidatus Marinarcus aquaticus]
MHTIVLEQITNPLWLSFKTIMVTTLLFLFLGTPLAYLLSKKKLPFRWLLDTLVTLPLVFPPIAVGFFLLLLLGKKSLIGEFLQTFNMEIIFSFTGIVIAAFIAGIPLMVKPLQAAIDQFPKAIKEASYLSGKSKLYTFVCIVLPTIKNALMVALLIATARALGEVGITLMLGGNIIGKTDTVSLAIYNAVFDGEFDLAMLLSAILVTISLLFFIALHWFEKRKPLV